MISSFNIFPIPSLQDNYIWAIIDATQQKACIVDPGEATPVNDFLTKNKLNLVSVLLTHHHWDHTGGVRQLKSEHGVPVYGAANSPNKEITHHLTEQTILSPETCLLDFQVLAIPGHTLDHLAYYCQDILFCGDTLFAAGCGRLFEGTPRQMYDSLQKIAALPDDTQIYCAHEYTLNNLHFAKTVEAQNAVIHERLERVKALRQKNLPSLPSRLKEEKQTNPFLRCDSPELISQVEKFAGQPLKTAVEIFTYLREWKDNFTL